MREIKVTETEAGVIVEAWGEAVWITHEEIGALTWGVNGRYFHIDVAVRTYTGKKIHNALLGFKCFDGGDWKADGASHKNGMSAIVIGTWAKVASDPKYAPFISRHGCERSTMPKALNGKIYYTFAYARDGQHALKGTYIAPDFATYLQRQAEHRAKHIGVTLAFRHWTK